MLILFRLRLFPSHPTRRRASKRTGKGRHPGSFTVPVKLIEPYSTVLDLNSIAKKRKLADSKYRPIIYNLGLLLKLPRVLRVSCNVMHSWKHYFVRVTLASTRPAVPNHHTFRPMYLVTLWLAFKYHIIYRYILICLLVWTIGNFDVGIYLRMIGLG